jgi:hypothetical protein
VTSLRERLRETINSGDAQALDALVAGSPATVRYLLGMTYQSDDALAAGACRGLAQAARHHPALVERVVRRLVWAMNDESGTNALSAPRVLLAVAQERPELLLPLVPDLVRLSADDGLRDGLSATLRTIAERCPGQVGQRLGEDLNHPELRRARDDARRRRLARARKVLD